MTKIFLAPFMFPLSFFVMSGFSAQDEKKAVEPEYVNQFFLLDSAGALKPLEHVTPQPKAKMKIGGANYYLVVPGKASPVRFAESKNLTFVVRVPSREVDPATIIQFYRLEVQGDERRLLSSRARVFSRDMKNHQDDSTIPFEALKYGEKSFTIKPKGDLSPGEYVFSTTTDKDGYGFGVDGATK